MISLLQLILPKRTPNLSSFPPHAHIIRTQTSLPDLSLDFFQFVSDVFEEVLKILFFNVQLLQLSLNPAVFALVVGQMPLAG